jgi:peroxiredoxin
MARIPNAPFLDAGDPFPQLELTLTDGRRLALPGDLSCSYNVVLVNRGAWCPYCVAQLKSFQSGLARLTEADIGVVSLSAESGDQAAALVGEHQIRFPVAHDAPVDTIARRLGVYYEPGTGERLPHLHSGAFVLGPGGQVLVALYSSGAIGRLAWQDVLGYVTYVRSHL